MFGFIQKDNTTYSITELENGKLFELNVITARVIVLQI